MKEMDPLLWEWQKTETEMAEKNRSLKELDFFLNLPPYPVASGPKVIMTGLCFPDEILRALGLPFCYVAGESFEDPRLRETHLPKDSDDAARSVCGILKSGLLALSKEDVLLVPLCDDNMKKLGAMVSDLVTVLCYEVPPAKEDPLYQERFSYEVKRVTKELEKHFGKRLSQGKLKEQCGLSKKAAEAFCELENTYRDKDALSAAAFLFLANTYCRCGDKADWTRHLIRLTEELKETPDSVPGTDAKILLFGSPVYPPNYKVLSVLEEMHMKPCMILHPDIGHIKAGGKTDPENASIRSLALLYLALDLSPAFIKNDLVPKLVRDALEDGNIRGIVAHDLKGQIEYDYQFGSVEKLAAGYGIPANQIETVYNYQDVEQIRLRLQAFSEMLGR